MKKLYTLGYEGLDITRFLKELKCMKVDVVVDVRRQTSSRRKDFSKNSLENSLLQKEINYIDLHELGTPKEVGDSLKKSGDYDAFFDAYRIVLRKKNQEVERICDLLKKNNVLLLCYERDHDKCHRKIIAEEVVRKLQNGVMVKPLSV